MCQKSPFRKSKRNGTELSEIMKFYLTANNSNLFSSVFCPKNGLERIFECFLFQESVWNGILKFFSLPKMVQNGIRRFFSLLKMIQNGNARFFLFQK